MDNELVLTILEELQDELEDETLTLDDCIQVQRDENGHIIDWCYDAEMMEEIGETHFTDPKEEAEKEAQYRAYLEMKEKLQTLTLREVLAELSENVRVELL